MAQRRGANLIDDGCQNENQSDGDELRFGGDADENQAVGDDLHQQQSEN